MTEISHQTIKLSRGSHTSAGDGACVMELASMLSGEPFTDNPVSACPVIASFLRAYNDSIDDSRRQDLYEFAARVVGSRRSVEVQRARIKRLSAWALQMRDRRSWRSFLPSPLRARGSSRIIGWTFCSSMPLIRWELTDETHAAALAIIDELLTMGDPDGSEAALGLLAGCATAAVPV
jgi:hypothetical protein